MVYIWRLLKVHPKSLHHREILSLLLLLLFCIYMRWGCELSWFILLYALSFCSAERQLYLKKSGKKYNCSLITLTKDCLYQKYKLTYSEFSGISPMLGWPPHWAIRLLVDYYHREQRSLTQLQGGWCLPSSPLVTLLIHETIRNGRGAKKNNCGFYWEEGTPAVWIVKCY